MPCMQGHGDQSTNEDVGVPQVQWREVGPGEEVVSYLDSSKDLQLKPGEQWVGECDCGWESPPALSRRSIEEYFVEHNKPPYAPHQVKMLHDLKIWAKASPAQRLRENKEQSKDSEKDEREWTPAMERAAKEYGRSLYESHLGYGERLWPIFDAAEVVPKARLQQVEVEVERVSQALAREEARAEVGWECVGKAEAELSIAREALALKLDEMELHEDTGDPRDEGYMSAWREFRDLVARLQAKEEGT